jgi:hypothetical protein
MYVPDLDTPSMEDADIKTLSQDDNSAAIPSHGEREGIRLGAFLFFHFESSSAEPSTRIAMYRDFSYYCSANFVSHKSIIAAPVSVFCCYHAIHLKRMSAYRHVWTTLFPLGIGDNPIPLPPWDAMTL